MFYPFRLVTNFKIVYPEEIVSINIKDNHVTIAGSLIPLQILGVNSNTFKRDINNKYIYEEDLVRCKIDDCYYTFIVSSVPGAFVLKRERYVRKTDTMLRTAIQLGEDSSENKDICWYSIENISDIEIIGNTYKNSDIPTS